MQLQNLQTDNISTYEYKNMCISLVNRALLKLFEETNYFSMFINYYIFCNYNSQINPLKPGTPSARVAVSAGGDMKAKYFKNNLGTAQIVNIQCCTYTSICSFLQ